MNPFLSSATLARGRGIGRLIEGMTNGEPAAIITAGAVVAVVVVIFIVRKKLAARGG